MLPLLLGVVVVVTDAVSLQGEPRVGVEGGDFAPLPFTPGMGERERDLA